MAVDENYDIGVGDGNYDDILLDSSNQFNGQHKLHETDCAATVSIQHSENCSAQNPKPKSPLW